MTHDNSQTKLLQKQPPMRRVILATLPCVGGSVYFFGWRSLAVIIVACAVGFIAEHVFCRRRNEPVSEAVFVTAILFGLIMPPTVSWHIVVFGMLFAVVITKMLFGGFGRNIFNPALAGRCFVYICFPVALTATWAPAAEGTWGALDRWTTAPTADAVSSATPMAEMKAAELEVARLEAQLHRDVRAGKTVKGSATEEQFGRAYLRSLTARPAVSDLFFGRVSGTMGVTSALLILIGGLYLFATKAANPSIILSIVITYAALNALLHALAVAPVPDVGRALLGGGFLFGAFFMATDPVSAARTKPGKIIYGVMIAALVVVIRNFSIFNGGLMFAILLGNMFAPIIDHAVMESRKRKAGCG